MIRARLWLILHRFTPTRWFYNRIAVKAACQHVDVNLVWSMGYGKWNDSKEGR